MSKLNIIKPKPPVLYDCDQCPAFCCSVYERVTVTDFDLTRLSEYFEMTEAETERRYTKKWGDERILKRRKDPVLETTCRFLDLKTRGCTIYHARPEACRDYPNQRRCPYYDLYQFESKHQDDPTVLPIVSIEFKEWKKKPRIEKGEAEQGEI